MAMGSSNKTAWWWLATVVAALHLLLPTCAGGGNGNGALRPNFYGATCPQAEAIVRHEVIRWLHGDLGFAAGLVRMHFHDCFVRGCDASVLLESTPDNAAERDSPVNNPSLRGFEVIHSAKARLEDACPGVVSCADILAFAARDSVALSGGPRYDVPGGRRDGTVSMASEVADNIPVSTFSLEQLTQNFAAKGLTQDEMVTLSGAHTIGRSHCSALRARLYNFSATAAADPSLDAAFLAQLQHACPAASSVHGDGVHPGLVVPMEPHTPYSLDTLYYRGVLRNRGLFDSDQALLASATTAAQVRQTAEGSYPWKLRFADAMVKMGHIQVLTGTSGQVRAKCGAVN